MSKNRLSPQYSKIYIFGKKYFVKVSTFFANNSSHHVSLELVYTGW
jgi:hypothetical protein